MKVLHVLKSEPDEIMRKLVGAFSEGNETREFEMFTADLDYDKLVELVFEYDKVICWW